MNNIEFLPDVKNFLCENFKYFFRTNKNVLTLRNRIIRINILSNFLHRRFLRQLLHEGLESVGITKLQVFYEI